MPNFINFKDSNGTTRKLLTNDWTTTEDSLKMVFSLDSPEFSALRFTSSTGLVRNSRARLFSFKAENTNATTGRFLMLFNQGSVVSSGATANLIDVFSIPANQVVVFGSNYFSQNGLLFTTGIAYAWSTSRTTYAGANTDLDLTVLSATV
jgi:hypothetical protein